MAQITDRLPFSGDGWYVPPTVTNGYTCVTCGCFVLFGTGHVCVTAMSAGHQCPRCNQWVFGLTSHLCPSACHHCYCIDVPPSGERTKPHHRCCKCSDVRVVKL